MQYSVFDVFLLFRREVESSECGAVVILYRKIFSRIQFSASLIYVQNGCDVLGRKCYKNLLFVEYCMCHIYEWNLFLDQYIRLKRCEQDAFIIPYILNPFAVDIFLS